VPRDQAFAISKEIAMSMFLLGRGLCVAALTVASAGAGESPADAAPPDVQQIARVGARLSEAGPAALSGRQQAIAPVAALAAAGDIARLSGA
jgi:hypothetical protein